MLNKIPKNPVANSIRRIGLVGLMLASVLTLTMSLTGAQPPSREIKVPQDFPTIQAAIDAAHPGDFIVISEGVYREYLTITKPLTLRPEPIFPDREDLQYVLIVNPPDFKPRSTVLICSAPGVTLVGLKITHNAIPPLSAIAIEAGPPGSLTSVTLKQIHAFGARDGGVRMGFGTPSEELPRECDIRPGIRGGRVDVTLTDSLLDGNPWAGIYVEGGLGLDSTLTVENSSIVGNGMGIGSLSGGARLQQLTIRNSLIADNKNIGGGLSSLGNLRVEELLLENNVIAHNGFSATPSFGGTEGVYVHATKAQLRGNLIWQNNGPGMAINPVFLEVLPTPIELSENVIRGNTGCGVELAVIPTLQILGHGNEISGNQQGDLCPPDFPWPAGFKK